MHISLDVWLRVQSESQAALGSGSDEIIDREGMRMYEIDTEDWASDNPIRVPLQVYE